MKHSTIKCKLLPIFSYSGGTGYELFGIKLFFKSSFDNTVGLPINNDKLLSWILSKGYAYPSNNWKYFCVSFISSRLSKCCQEQREDAVLVPREFWVVREAEYRSIRSKTRQKIPNIELQIQSQILSDINSQEGKITDMAGSRFREEGRTWPELVRSTVFC